MTDYQLTRGEQAALQRVFPGADTGNPVERQTLLDLIEAERADHAAYRMLASGTRGQTRRLLMELAADEAKHMRRLSAHCFLRYGSWPQPASCALPRPACSGRKLWAQLREHYQDELAGANTYARLAAAEQGELRYLLEDLAKDELRHSRILLQILEQ